jgi:hypothetical protein
MKKYATIPRIVEAVQLESPMTIGVLSGAPGDWLLVSGGRMSFLPNDRFKDSYKEHRVQAPKPVDGAPPAAKRTRKPKAAVVAPVVDPTAGA